MNSEPCQFLEWDTEFFGHRIARINGTHLDAPRMNASLEWYADAFFKGNFLFDPDFREIEGEGKA